MATPPVFQAFDPNKPVTIYRRNMPHWRQLGCTYFVTFRLADSIPAFVVRQWVDERRTWLLAHGIQGSLQIADNMDKYLQISRDERTKFEKLQGRRLHQELDRYQGCCCLEQPAIRKCLQDALHHFDGTRWHCGDWVIMPNHVHVLCMPIDDWQLERLLQSIKRFVATHAGTSSHADGKSMWQKESYDHIVRNNIELAALRKYIAENPAKAKLDEGRFSWYRAVWLDSQ